MTPRRPANFSRPGCRRPATSRSTSAMGGIPRTPPHPRMWRRPRQQRQQPNQNWCSLPNPGNPHPARSTDDTAAAGQFGKARWWLTSRATPTRGAVSLDTAPDPTMRDDNARTFSSKGGPSMASYDRSDIAARDVEVCRAAVLPLRARRTTGEAEEHWVPDADRLRGAVGLGSQAVSRRSRVSSVKSLADRCHEPSTIGMCAGGASTRWRCLVLNDHERTTLGEVERQFQVEDPGSPARSTPARSACVAGTSTKRGSRSRWWPRCCSARSCWWPARPAARWRSPPSPD